jgi:hypothetical protein
MGDEYFIKLLADTHTGAKGCSRILRHEAHLRATHAVEANTIKRQYVDAIEHNLASVGAETSMTEAKKLESHRGLAASGLADQPQYLAASY